MTHGGRARRLSCQATAHSFAAQSEAIAAALKIAFTGESPYGLGEIGSGKTTLATALLWALAALNYESTWQRCSRANRPGTGNLGPLARVWARGKTAIRPVRAALVLCPPHPLKSWQDQCQAVIPGASVVVIREPADLVRIRALREVPIKAAVAPAKPGKALSISGDHDQPLGRAQPGTGLTVALLTRETAKLGHGYEHGYARSGAGKVSCPKCGTTFDAGTEEDAVRRRTRCEQTVSSPANPPALLAIEVAHRAAGLIKADSGPGSLRGPDLATRPGARSGPGPRTCSGSLRGRRRTRPLFKGSYGDAWDQG